MKIGTLIIRFGRPLRDGNGWHRYRATSKTAVPGAADVAKSIRAQNVDCPTVMSVASRGQDAYGRVFRVRCGPVLGASGGGSYLKVTIQANGEAVITPEHDLPDRAIKR